MHELSIASQAVDKITETALDRGAKKINGVEFLIGELSLLGTEQLSFWINQMLNSRLDIAKDVKITFEAQKASVECKSCGYKGGLKPKGDEDHHNPLFSCPSCNQTDLKITSGRECLLKRIHLET